MANKIVGSILATSASTDKIIVNRSGELREMALESIGINHIELTSTVSGVNTYTLYRSADTSVVFGSFQVKEGIDGTGLSITDYQSAKVYDKHSTVVDDDGNIYRYTNNTAASGKKPQVSGVVNTDWERLFVGQPNQFDVINSATIATNSAQYLTDTSAASFTLTIPAGVNVLSVEDLGGKWTDANFLTVSIGTDHFEFKLAQSGVTYKFKRVGAQFRVTGSDDTTLWGNV